MAVAGNNTKVRALFILHPAFALTGIVHAAGGPLLPSIAAAMHLNDSQSGSIFLFYFAGTSIGALLCGANHARSMITGFAGLTATCFGIAAVRDPMLLLILFLAAGIFVGMPMTAVSMYAGSRFGSRSAAPLTFLNFSWSAGALAAPLLAASLLLNHTYRAAYVVLACASLAAAAACALRLAGTSPPSPPQDTQAGVASRFRWIALFALLTFLEVGIENTTATWLATFALRTKNVDPAHAAASSSLYWWGFLASRAAFSVLLLRMPALRILFINTSIAIGAASFLLVAPGTAFRGLSMFILGAALAPIFPLLLARFFALNRRSSESRWVLATCGFGGSVLPWLTGFVSTHTGNLRVGLAVVPSALFLIVCVLPAIARSPELAQASTPPASA